MGDAGAAEPTASGLEKSDDPVKKKEAAWGESPSWVEVAKLAPPVLWFCLALLVVVNTYDPLMDLVKRGALRKIGIGTVELEFAEVHLRRVRGLNDQGIPESEQKALLGRFDQLADQLEVTSILWVDDKHPEQNASLRPLLTSLGVNIDLATSTEDALEWMDQAHYDIIITNLHRPNDPSAPCYSSPQPANAGCALLKNIGSSRTGEWPRLLVYTGNFEPENGTPAFAEDSSDSTRTSSSSYPQRGCEDQAEVMNQLAPINRVILMTPENIHLNSFIYEPILDISDEHLRKLYKEVAALT